MFKADLHIHSVLSPCGDLEMSPRNIVKMAVKKELDVISVTDHNSTRQSAIMAETAKEHGLGYFFGVEVTTKEEIHVLCYFQDLNTTNEFQHYLDENLLKVKNNPEKFGFQVVVDTNEDIVYEEENLLITALNKSLDEITVKVHELNGLVIPAHINKQRFSLVSQLGFIPPELDCDGVEVFGDISRAELKSNYFLSDDLVIVRNSDAHYLQDIGRSFTILKIKNLDFSSFKDALINSSVEECI